MKTVAAFQETMVRFRNAATVRVREIQVESSSVALVLKACRDLFGVLDRSDDFQAILSRRLWELRASVLFTMLPFDSIELGLAGRLQTIMNDAMQIPAAIEVTNILAKGIHNLIEHPINLKHRWLVENPEHPDATGLVTMMAMGQNFGWPSGKGDFSELVGDVQLIDSVKALAAKVFDRIIIPGTCHYFSARMYSEIFHLGRTRTVDVLLYQGERFSMRDRLNLPESTIFRGRLTASRIIHTSDVVLGMDDDLGVDTDDQIKNSVWELTHEGHRTPGPGLHAARYILFKDGRGMFVPENTHMLVWSESNNDTDSTLENVHVEQVAEGDWLAIRLGDTGRLLDLVSAEAGFGKKMEEVCDWRPALDALMLTYSPDQIAKEMHANGAHGISLAHSLRSWADGTVYGPGTQNELRSLLNVLISHRKLPNQDNLDQYVMDHWKGLKELRGIRLRAGMSLHSNIHHQLANALSNHAVTSENQAVRLENGMQVQLCQVAAVDDQLSWVPHSKLLYLQAMRGGRWQG